MKKENINLAVATMTSLANVQSMMDVTVSTREARKLLNSPYAYGYHFDVTMHPELFEHIKATLIEALEQDLRDLGVEV